MALVQISDLIVPEVYANYMMLDTVEKAGVFTSGLVQPDQEMQKRLTDGGRLFQYPRLSDLADDAPSIPTDNPADVITPGKIGSGKHQFIRQMRTKAWSSADLARELAGVDPMGRIRDRTGAYWDRYFNKVAVYTLNGIVNDNVANDASDMVLDVTALTGTEAVGGVTVSKFVMSAKVILEAKQTLGDAADELTILVMHSRLYTNLQLQQLITFIPNARGEVNIPTYLGYRVVVSDTCPVTVSGSDLIFTSYLAAPGVLGWAEKPPAIPVEVEREAKQGMGAGVETLVTRRQYSMHPYGFTFKDASVAGEFPTDAELQLAANWDRSYPERKMIKLAVMRTKNG